MGLNMSGGNPIFKSKSDISYEIELLFIPSLVYILFFIYN